MATKQADIAKYCKVSPAAVSKILRHPEHPEFPESTRKRILSAAKKLHYVPNQLAAGLRRGRTTTVSLLSAWNVPELQDAISHEANHNGHNVMLQFIQDGDIHALFRAIDSVLSNQPAGVIWLPAWGDKPEETYPQADAIIDKIRTMGCPVVWLEDEPPYRDNCDFAWCDDAGGIRQAVDHLCQCGYTNYVYLVAARPHLPRPLRWSVFQQEVFSRGMAASYVECSSHTHAEDPRVFRYIKDCPPRTAIVCEGDWPAVPVLHSSAQLGRAIPDDIGVMTFGDMHLGGGFSLGEVTHPKLTAIRRCFDQIGNRAIRMLMERINGSYTGPLRSEALPTKLIERESTGRA